MENYLIRGILIGLLFGIPVGAVGAYTDGTHGMTLSAIICPYGLAKFRRFAVNVCDVDPQGKTDKQVAAEEQWYSLVDFITIFDRQT